MNTNFKTTLTNRLLLLWLLNDATKYNTVGATKAHKLTYLSQLAMTKQKEKGLSYNFKKLDCGPYSDKLKIDLKWLEQQQLITSEPFKDGELFQNTIHGNKIISDFEEMFTRNNTFIRRISDVNCKYAKYNTHNLVSIVHRQRNPEYPNITIHKTPLNDTILHALPSESAKNEFIITPEEEETLEIYMDVELFKNIKEACDSVRSEHLFSLYEVF
ncbi:MAG: hypothetical protein FWH37_01135 [Candidatus Bathyarchaeota archaeon]|nr:hypothetical protein [Candidatus Termiticorpusculum sp.]